MPTRLIMWAATPRCPGRPTNVTTHHRNHGLAKGRTEITTTQHIPCERPTQWDHQYETWECPTHGTVLTGEQAVAHWTDTIETPAVEAEAA